MKSTRTTTTTAEKERSPRGNAPMFERENYIWMLAGVVVLAIGLLLMAGGKSSDPTVFNDNEVYSFRRITLAPIVILIGLAIEIFALVRKSRKS